MRFLLFFLTLLAPLAAQNISATLNGTVRDASGAVIASAAVSLSNDATGATREARSNAEGYFAFTDLLAGSYSITVGYLGVHATHLPRSRDINLFPSVLTQGTLSTGEAISYWRHPGTSGPARPNPAFGRTSREVMLDAIACEDFDPSIVHKDRNVNCNLSIRYP